MPNKHVFALRALPLGMSLLTPGSLSLRSHRLPLNPAHVKAAAAVSFRAVQELTPACREGVFS